MTQEQYDSATEEEKNAEWERIKDPVYFYNTYWKKADAPDIDRETFEEMFTYVPPIRHSRR